MAISGEQAATYGTPWSRGDLILAFELYCRIPFKKTKANNPDVIELARFLNRTPAAVARKLGNFGSLDPELRKREVAGLGHVGKLDLQIWDEFNSDWNRLVVEASLLRDAVAAPRALYADDESPIRLPEGPSEYESLRKNRIHQAFFRDVVLSSYESTCCITGICVKEALTASHIVPWSVSEEHRADPRNGLCLSATFDKLFDCGLVTVDDAYAVVVSSALQDHSSEQVRELICFYHNAPIRRPRRFLPEKRHLEWHRKHIFHQ